MSVQQATDSSAEWPDRLGLDEDTQLETSASINNTVNQTGFAALPVELVLMIVMFIPWTPVTSRTLEDDDTQEPFIRPQTLRALSLTCRWIRSVVIRLMWRSVEVCRLTGEDVRSRTPAPMKDSPEWKRAMATQLVRKIEIVTVREPSYAPTVRLVAVILTDFAAPNVYPEFFRGLSCLSSLKVLQILSIPKDCIKHLEAASQHKVKVNGKTIRTHYVYDSVKFLALPSSATTIFRCFPGPTFLELMHQPGDNPLQLFRSIGTAAFEHVKQFEYSGIPRDLWDPSSMVDELSRSMPRLTVLPFWFVLLRDQTSLPDMQALSSSIAKFKELATLHFANTEKNGPLSGHPHAEMGRGILRMRALAAKAAGEPTEWELHEKTTSLKDGSELLTLFLKPVSTKR